MRAVFVVALAFLSIGLSRQPACAEKRGALVMGNSAYQKAPPLSNPVNDASAMAKMFSGAGFDVVELRHDLKANEMRRALRDFSDVARDADVAIVYYAGHGVEIDGVNYLIPVDATLERDIDAFDEAVKLVGIPAFRRSSKVGLRWFTNFGKWVPGDIEGPNRRRPSEQIAIS